MGMKVGDVVSRNSYGNDILFRITGVERDRRGHVSVKLRGIELRLLADAAPEDLKLEDAAAVGEARRLSLQRAGEQVRQSVRRSLWNEETLKRNEALSFRRLPKILHLDGDGDYVRMCMDHYRKAGLPAYGMQVSERRQAEVVPRLLREVNPDILVLTGHDALYKGAGNLMDAGAYAHSLSFMRAVQAARRLRPDLDDLVIFAGACQSCFEGLIDSGANFASSPYRVLIHALDPIAVAEQVAFTPADEMAELATVIGSTITGQKGVGGVATRGKLRTGLPRSPFFKKN